jgi:hypothetical protein
MASSKVHPWLSKGNQQDDSGEVFLRELSAGCIRVWQRVASMERILRKDEKRGVMPEVLTARPKGQGGLAYWND